MSKCAYEPLTDQERSQFVCSFFINNNDLYLHLGPGGPVEIFNKIYRITRSSVGDIEKLRTWYQDL